MTLPNSNLNLKNSINLIVIKISFFPLINRMEYQRTSRIFFKSINRITSKTNSRNYFEDTSFGITLKNYLLTRGRATSQSRRPPYTPVKFDSSQLVFLQKHFFYIYAFTTYKIRLLYMEFRLSGCEAGLS